MKNIKGCPFETASTYYLYLLFTCFDRMNFQHS